MELQIAENKITKILEKQRRFNAISALDEIKILFLNLDQDQDTIWIYEKQKLQSDIDEIMRKYNLNQIAMNIFQIIEKIYSKQEKHKISSIYNYEK